MWSIKGEKRDGELIMNYYAITDIGKLRKTNQDRVLVCANENSILGIVCDGVGGAQDGDVASQLSIDFLENSFKEIPYFENEEKAQNWFKDKIYALNQLVMQKSKEISENCCMGTTLVLAYVTSKFIMYLNVGDSRGYFFKDKLEQVTDDHSYVNFLVKRNEITKEMAKVHPQRNYLLSAIGIYDKIMLDFMFKKIQDGIILLSSDGLHGYVDDDEINQILKQNKSLKEKGEELVNIANQKGGFDNIGIVLIETRGEN